MLAKIKSAAVIGLGGELVEVEVDLAGGFPSFTIVGLPDAAVQEAKERMKAAIKNSGLDFPATRHIVINLAPADLRKEGPAYDLPMAVGLILGALEMPFPDWEKNLFVGELALDGSLRRTNGILPLAIFAREKNIKEIFLPETNAAEASLIEGIIIRPVKNLSQLVRHLANEEKISPYPNRVLADFLTDEETIEFDMAHVKGQEYAKRALEIAASGGHNILMSGPPGSGKTLLARTLPTILPKMNGEESLEVTKIYSVAGRLPPDEPLITRRPFRSPHHTASGAALVGGGKNPRPGEISLAHRGVLFLDELPEFSRQVLENLRQPLEDGLITISRAQGTLTFPARFSLVASQNPCPCGYASDPEKPCLCSPLQVAKYRKKISGPLLDRIDLHIEVPRVKFQKLAAEETEAESSAKIRQRVEAAREKQKIRFQDRKIYSNTEMTAKEIKEFCRISDQAMNLLRQAVTQMHLSARSYHRLLKVGRTIADLADSEQIVVEHLAEALQYRARAE